MKKREIISCLKKLDRLPLPEKEIVLGACEDIITIPVERRITQRKLALDRKVAIIAIAASLLIIGGISVTAAEAAEYGKASEFFDQYELSREGLTRSEVKKVYRDIYSESFSFEKTAEIITRDLEGYEITSNEMTSDDISRLWLVNYSLKQSLDSDDLVNEYKYSISHVMSDYDNAEESFYYDELTKSSGNKKIWTKRFDNFYIESICAVGNKVLVAGDSSSDGSIYSGSNVGVYLIGADSSIEWYREFDAKKSDTDVNYVLYTDDLFVMFIASRGSLWVTEIDMSGNVISDERIKYDSTEGRIMRAVKIDNSYLLLRDNKLSRLKDGKISDSVSYYTNDGMYEINDMIEYNGLVYLSGRVLSTDGRDNIGLLEKYEDIYGPKGASDEELLAFFQNNHTAVLLVCDPQNANAITFYSLTGGEGSSLESDKGRLIWNVNRYTSATVYNGDLSTLYASSGNFASIDADIWNYVFNSCGQLVAEGATDFKTITDG